MEAIYKMLLILGGLFLGLGTIIFLARKVTPSFDQKRKTGKALIKQIKKTGKVI